MAGLDPAIQSFSHATERLRDWMAASRAAMTERRSCGDVRWLLLGSTFAYISGTGTDFCAQAARTVLCNRQAIVIGPTPPGTGVIEPATLAQDAKSQSPTSFPLPSRSIRLIPTSITQ